MKKFHLSTDGDPDLNLFTEFDVEKSFSNKGMWWHLMERSISNVEVLQRKMMRAVPGDRIPFGKIEIVAVEV